MHPVQVDAPVHVEHGELQGLHTLPLRYFVVLEHIHLELDTTILAVSTQLRQLEPGAEQFAQGDIQLKQVFPLG